MNIDEMSDKIVEEVKAGKFAEALKIADEIIAAAPPEDLPEGLWFVRGIAEENLGKLPQAIDSYTAATKENSAAWYRLGNLFVITGQFARAVPAMRKAFEVQPELARDAAALATLSWALNETGDSKAVLEVIEDARKSDPKLFENGQLDLHEGIARTALQEWEKGLEALERAAERIPEGPPLGVVRLQQGLARQGLNEHAEAVKFFALAVDLPTAEAVRTWIWIHMSRSYIALEDKAKADEALDNAAGLASKSIPDSIQLQAALLQIGLARQSLGEHAEAIKLFQDALTATQPSASHVKLWLHVARSYVALKDPAAASEALYHAERMAGESIKEPLPLANTRIEIGFVRQSLGEHSEALRVFESALDDSLDDSSRAWLLLSIARNLIALNNRDAALQAVEKASKKPASDAGFFLFKAELSMTLNRPEEALLDLNQVTTLDPQSAQAWIQKAGLLIGFERFPEAMTAVKNAIDYAPDAPSRAIFSVGKANVLTRQGDFGAALTALDEATAFDSSTQNVPRFVDLKAEIFRGLRRDKEIPALFEKAAQDPKARRESKFPECLGDCVDARGQIPGGI